MPTAKLVVGAKSALTFTPLATLASATYGVSDSYNAATNSPVDAIVELSAATTNTPAGNKQLLVFAQASFDAGSTWQSGPTSGTTTTDENLLTFLGALPVNLTATTYVKAFEIASAYGGVLPPMFRIVIRNDLGVALTSGTAAVAEQTATLT